MMPDRQLNFHYFGGLEWAYAPGALARFQDNRVVPAPFLLNLFAAVLALN